MTEKELIILKNDELEREDSVFTTKETSSNVLLDSLIPQTESLQKLSFINLDKLKERYKTEGMSDGMQISVKLTKDNKTKKIHLSNYYHPDIRRIIDLVNSMCPKKYQIRY